MKKSIIFSSNKALISILLLLVLTGWWLMLAPFHPTDATEHARYIWGGIYQIMAYWGAFNGFYIVYRLGSKSIVGKAILAFSTGLLFQGIGQTIYTYNLFHLHIEAPYPSLGDVGYFGSIFFYTGGALLLTKVSGISASLRSKTAKLASFLIPAVILVVSYFFFLQGYQFDWSHPLTILLDFGYPLGQAIYVSIAVWALVLSRTVPGGALRKPLLSILLALILQYASDFTFLYQSSRGVWYVAGINDFMYCCSYFLMAFSLIYLGIVFYKIRSESTSTTPIARPETNAADSGNILNQIIVAIIQRQERVAGQVAWEEARKIPTLVVDQANATVTVNGDPKDAIDQLVKGYQSLFGTTAADVSRNAARFLVAELPDDQVPTILK